MLIAMAGLPASGKSTIARALATRLSGVLLDKDEIRAALFSLEDIEYSSQQDDFCLGIMFQVAEYLLEKNPDRYVILDGRPFCKRYQVENLVESASRIRTHLCIIECTVTDEDAHLRLETDDARESHLAANRGYELFRRLKAQAEPIEYPKLIINTSNTNPQTSIEKALEYVLSKYSG